jgi:hypothetical protein
MAGRKLTEEEKARYNWKMSLTRARKEKEKAEKLKAAKEAKGTQANHHVTSGKDVTKSITKGASNGVLGIAVAGMAAFNTEAKRIANMKNQIN